MEGGTNLNGSEQTLVFYSATADFRTCDPVMNLHPNDWNVVIIGYWNLAILSPAGIANRLFHVAEDTPIEVLVALDGVAPIQAKYEGITVIPDDKRLVVGPVVATAQNMERAKKISAEALKALPQTPVHAVGVNFRYVGSTIDADDEFLKLLKHDSDDSLSDAEFQIVARSHSRSIRWKEGVLNISLTTDDENTCKVLFNFELKSTDVNALISWLAQPVEEFLSVVKTLISDYLSSEAGTIEEAANV